MRFPGRWGARAITSGRGPWWLGARRRGNPLSRRPRLRPAASARTTPLPPPPSPPSSPWAWPAARTLVGPCSAQEAFPQGGGARPSCALLRRRAQGSTLQWVPARLVDALGGPIYDGLWRRMPSQLCVLQVVRSCLGRSGGVAGGEWVRSGGWTQPTLRPGARRGSRCGRSGRGVKRVLRRACWSPGRGV